MYVFDKTKMLLPKNTDMTKWSVVACDQYTSEPKYWDDVKKTVGNNPSTLNIIFPEIFLNEENSEKRISDINENMKKYLENGILYETEKCLIYVERTLKNEKVRKGIVGAIDLEKYDFSPKSESSIRATEKTVIERIPPRVKIRENAVLELPHIMLLIDDEKKEIIESLSDKKDSFEKLYDFPLMMDSGSIKGYKLSEKECSVILEKLSALEDKNMFEEKYGVKNKGVLSFAVGDGNHSLATAKTCYENAKKTVGEKEAEKIRYALVELVNLHDDSLEFEAIHRVLFNVDAEKFMCELKKKYDLKEEDGDGSFEIITGNADKTYTIKNPDCNLTVGCLQSFIDKYLEENGGSIDYIHGSDVTKNLAKEKGNMGIILKPMKKSQLFKTVILDGSLPRKTFSMGEACDKRFYLEGRKLI